MPKAERSAMPVTMPGSAMGRMKSSEMWSRPKKFGARYGSGGAGAENERQEGRDAGDLHGEADGIPDVLPFPDYAEPFCGVAGGRELEAFFLGGEGIEEDQQQWHMQEGHAGQGGNFQQ